MMKNVRLITFPQRLLALLFLMLIILAGSISWGQTTVCLDNADVWTGSGLANTTGQGCDGEAYVFNGSGDMATSPVVTNPSSLTFQRKRSGNTTAWSMDIEISTNATYTTWVTVASLSSISATCASQTVSLTAYTGARVIRFKDTRGSGSHERTISDIEVTCTSTTYTLSYNANGGTGAPAGSTSYTAGATFTVSGTVPTRTGFTFGGWNSNAAGTGTNYNASTSYTMPAANTILYAKWTAIPTYSLTYNGNGNTGGTAPTGGSYASGTSVTLAAVGTLVKTGYTFGGWNTNAAGTGTNYNAGASFSMPASATVLYAKWNCTPATISVAPTSGPSGTYVTITGNNFSAASTVRFGGIASTEVDFVSANEIEARIPANLTVNNIEVTTTLACPSTASFTIVTKDVSGCE